VGAAMHLLVQASHFVVTFLQTRKCVRSWASPRSWGTWTGMVLRCSSPMLPGVLFLLFASESSNDVLLLLEPGPLTVEPGPRLQAHEYGHQTAPSQPTLHEGQRYCSKIAFQSPQDSMLNLSHLWYLMQWSNLALLLFSGASWIGKLLRDEETYQLEDSAMVPYYLESATSSSVTEETTVLAPACQHCCH